MFARDPATSLRSAAARPTFAGQAANLVAALLKALRNRRDFYRLGELSDAELSDIGLTRADLHVAFGKPLTEDPTAYLGRVAEARHGSR